MSWTRPEPNLSIATDNVWAITHALPSHAIQENGDVSTGWRLPFKPMREGAQTLQRIFNKLRRSFFTPEVPYSQRPIDTFDKQY